MNSKSIFKMGIMVVLALVLTVSLASADAGGTRALGSGFTYQGQLKSSDAPYNGSCDFQFMLYDHATAGAQVGTTQTLTGVTLDEGYFNVALDFGATAFNGDPRWLQIWVRCPAGSGTYQVLSPRQALTAAPYAWFAQQASSTPWDGITGKPAGFTDGVDNVGWDMTGNAGANPTTNYLGTSDNFALELRVNGLRALRLEPHATSPNLIGGHSDNWITSGVWGATIAGGGGQSGTANRVTGLFCTVGGGSSNQAGDDDSTLGDACYATVSGGNSNTASGTYASIGGGSHNTASASASTVGGGEENSATMSNATVSGGHYNSASDSSSSVGGGEYNVASNEYSTIGGGYDNTASGLASVVAGGVSNSASNEAATVAGGDGNDASGYMSTVGGGYINLASGEYATIPGGYYNFAQGNNSFAAGTWASAYNPGCFVWGDAHEIDVPCNYDNRWVARASGGVYFYTASDLSSGSFLSAGSGAWADLSDRNMKENLEPVEPGAVLDALMEVPVSTWNYITQDESIRHMGPMAQDFYAAFGVGENDTTITTIDADGVALAAIQGLYAENQALKTQLADLEARLDALETSKVASSNPSGGSFSLMMGLSLAAVAGVWVLRRPRGGEG